MTLIRRIPLTRRTVLRGLGGLALGLPLLDAMRGSPAHAGGSEHPKRFIVMYTPNGTIAKNFWPTSVLSETEFQLSPILTPLAKHKDDLLIIGGVDMLSAMAPNLDGKSPGDAHQKGTGGCLTATELLPGNFIGGGGQTAGWAGGISVDQAIANHIGQNTPYKSVELGVAVQGANVGGRISYRGPGQPLPPENSPYAAYQRLFGDSLGDPLEVEQRIARRHSVLDVVAEDYKRLRDRLGGEDREKLHNHLLGIDAIRDRLDKAVVKFDGVCQPLDLGPALDVNKIENMPIIGGLQMDLLAMAFACDLTRVATLMWTNSTSSAVLSFIDPAIKDGHHALAHKGDEETVKVHHNTLINTWYASQLGALIDRLKAIPEGDGTVFDNTVILWTNEQARGNNHDRHDLPYVLAGGVDSVFNTGRYVEFPGDTGHNRLLVSLLNAMDIDATEFGNPIYGTGPLSGLT
ncbi:DUF1552 domain-containing protein [Enhygromyxa salina]|uniref:Tat (Twin-arginine translocation) pathway signal sequence domain protein n=1 Tax=Enhygromyxa salina TaxID=215803 RepID=A0A2S9YU77_9BACT|nr:DUF1552 domain-containing protein [Enhygromyxa salina]PRQ08630.1 hypothetical protein ENSA7_16360 [Enhygromyxa salina]